MNTTIVFVEERHRNRQLSQHIS